MLVVRVAMTVVMVTVRLALLLRVVRVALARVIMTVVVRVFRRCGAALATATKHFARVGTSSTK